MRRYISAGSASSYVQCVRRLAVMVCVGLVAACSSGGGPGAAHTTASSSSDAVSSHGTAPTKDELQSALREFFALQVTGQWGASWEHIIPAEQSAVTKDKYVACHAGESGIGEVSDIDVTDTRSEPFTPPGLTAPIDSMVVTFDATVNGKRTAATVHEFPVHGQLRFALTPSDFRACST